MLNMYPDYDSRLKSRNLEESVVTLAAIGLCWM